MTFYVRKSGDSDIEGPFTIEQINQMAKDKTLTADSLAIVNRNQTLEQIKLIPQKQWHSVGVIQGFVPVEGKGGCWMPILIVILLIIAVIVVLALTDLSNFMHWMR